MIDAWWNFYFEDTITPHVTHYELALVEESESEDPNIVVGYVSSHLDTHCKFTDMSLISGFTYMIHVRPCMQGICMPSISSDGFTVSSDIPVAGDIEAEIDFEYTEEGTEANVTLTLEWEPFAFPSSENETAELLYIWTISSQVNVANHIIPWATYDGPTDGEMLMVSALNLISESRSYMYMYSTSFKGWVSHTGMGCY